MRIPSSSPMARFQARLDHLFHTVRAPDGGEYTYRQVATDIERLVGYKTSSSYLQELRTGIRINPSMKHLHGLCVFFGVPIAYFFDEDHARRVDAQLDLAASLRDPAVRDLAIHASGLQPDALQAIIQIVDHARRIEGLDGSRTGAGASNDSRPAFHPRRRGRRARVRAGETPTTESPPAHEAL